MVSTVTDDWKYKKVKEKEKDVTFTISNKKQCTVEYGISSDTFKSISVIQIKFNFVNFFFIFILIWSYPSLIKILETCLIYVLFQWYGEFRKVKGRFEHYRIFKQKLLFTRKCSNNNKIARIFLLWNINNIYFFLCLIQYEKNEKNAVHNLENN